MSIRTLVPCREQADRLSLLERCAEMAPEGTYEDAKQLAEFFSKLHTFMRTELADIGLKVSNTDPYREVEGVVYAMIKNANPDSTLFPVAEGFGEHVDGPAGERILAQAASNRDFLRGLGVIPGGNTTNVSNISIR